LLPSEIERTLSNVQLVPIKVPIPFAVVSWKKDSQGRHTAPIPGFGELVRLSTEQEQTAREKIAASTEDPQPLVFEIEFMGGTIGLFMASHQAALVESGVGSNE
jgi:hypothetical protein